MEYRNAAGCGAGAVARTCINALASTPYEKEACSLSSNAPSRGGDFPAKWNCPAQGPRKEIVIRPCLRIGPASALRQGLNKTTMRTSPP